MTPHANGAFPAGVREAARKLHARGFRPIPVGYRTKTPAGGEGWNSVDRAGFDADAEFPDFRPHNLGLLNGQPSGGLVDVDLDCPEARAAGAVLLPPTGMAWGRKSAPGSHYGYRVGDPPDRAAENFDDPAGGHLMELRSTGGMTVVPPSVAPADPDAGKAEEPVVWARDGDPAEVSLAHLRSAVASAAAAAVLARHWPKGARHDAALGISGGLLRAGWAVEHVARFLTAVCAAAGDPEVEDRVRTAAGTAERLAEGNTAAGWPTAAKHLGVHGEMLVKQVREWLGIAAPKTNATFGGATPGKATGSPPKYAPLPPYRSFPVDALPPVVREFASEVAAAMRVDPAFAALPALGAAAGMIGATRAIRLKRSWAEPAILWTAVVGDSGTLKSPPYKLAIAPVLKIQADYFRQHRTAMDDYRREAREYEREKRRCRDADPGDPPIQPVCTRVTARDTTVEALAAVLDGNRARMLVARDEASGWLASFNQYKARGGSDMANWLELHALGALAIDRKTGEPRTVYIPRVGVSLCGGIQPGVLRKALSAEQMSAGVPARLLFAYPPRRSKRWTEADIDAGVERRYGHLIRALERLEPQTDEDGDPDPVALPMTPEAKAEWVAFYNRFADRQADAEGDLAAAFSKLEGYAARLALVYHVCGEVTLGNAADTPVTLEAVRAGITLATWFADEAERVYRMLAEEDEERETRQLVEHAERLAGRHGGRVTARLLQRSNQRKYRTVETAEEALEMLVGLGLGRWEVSSPRPNGGWSPRAFVPCVTCDTSYTRPDPGDDPDTSGGPPGCDTPPCPPGGCDGPGTGPPAATPTGRDGCGEPAAGGPDQVYEVSHVTHEPGEHCEPTEPRGGRESTVTPVAETRVVTYTLVTDADALARVAAALERHHGPVGLDTETTGLDPARDRVRLIQLAVGEDVFLIDLFAFAEPPPVLAGLFGSLARSEVVGHNIASFDLPFLARLGFHPSKVFDTLLASKVVYAGGDVGHGLADAAERELGRRLDKSHQKDDWAGTLTPGMLAYAAADAGGLVPLAEVLVKKAETAGLTAVLDLEMRAAVPVAGMAAAGVGFDPGPWLAAAAAAAADRDRLRAELDAMAPDPAGLPGIACRNWNSRDQVLAALKGVGLDLADTTEETLAGLGHPLAATILAYRGADKAAGTYGREWVDQHVVGGRVYATWKPYGARTGRMSCGDPNLQQVPRGVAYRRSFSAPSGRVLVKADYSQIELRIAAKVTGDARMTEAYRDGLDLHALTAARFLGVPASEVPKAARQTAKPVNFGAIYGLSAPSLKRKAKAEYGKDITVGEAAGFLDAFFGEFPGVRRWHDAFKRRPPKQVRTLGGRAVALPPTAFFGTCANYVVQGTGGDGLKRALVLLWDRRAEVPDARVVLAVHDEVVVEVPESQSEMAAAWLARAMTDAMAPLIAPVPVVVEPAVGPTWGG